MDLLTMVTVVAIFVDMGNEVFNCQQIPPLSFVKNVLLENSQILNLLLNVRTVLWGFGVISKVLSTKVLAGSVLN
jgi:hypothetical protein